MTITKDDIKRLNGKFVILLNNDFEATDDRYNGMINASAERIKDSIYFYVEKRISLITTNYMFKGPSKHSFVNLMLTIGDPLTEDEFVEQFNNPGDNRYYRLMTSDELQVLFEYMQKNQY